MEELLALPMSVVEEQAKELGVDAAGVFDCWWALFGNRAAENGGRGDSVYRGHQELKQAGKPTPQAKHHSLVGHS